MQLRFTIFTKLFHSVQFTLLWSFLRKLLRRPLTATNKAKPEPFWLCCTHGLRFSPHNQAKPTTNPLPQAEKAKNVEQKALIGLQRHNQPKANPRWETKSMY